LPIIKRQTLDGGPITVTNTKMTRFILSISDAVSLTFRTLSLAKGGEVFVLKMPAVYVGDLIEVYCRKICRENHIERNNIETKFINHRPGEKLNEKLLSDYEVSDCYENADFFIIPSKFGDSNKPLKKGRYRGFGRVKNYSGFDSSKIKKISASEIESILEKTEFEKY
jgi:FlaA1/EpsC-like NDP-sugar epimerase